ncbi:hypothetical protein JCM15415_04300 [Methanobacterium movens]
MKNIRDPAVKTQNNSSLLENTSTVQFEESAIKNIKKKISGKER